MDELAVKLDAILSAADLALSRWRRARVAVEGDDMKLAVAYFSDREVDERLEEIESLVSEIRKAGT